MLETMIINMLLGILHSAFKNPQKKEQLKHALLEVRDGINALYPDDAGFLPSATALPSPT